MLRWFAAAHSQCCVSVFEYFRTARTPSSSKVAASAVEFAIITATAPLFMETTSQHAAVAAPSSQVVPDTPSSEGLFSSIKSCGTRSATPAPVITTASTNGAKTPATPATATPAKPSAAYLTGHPALVPATMIILAAIRQEAFATRSAQ